MLGLSTLAFSGASASAAAMLPLSPVVTGQANAGSDGIVQVDHKKNNNWDNKKWNKRYGKRCDYFNDRCRYRYRDHFYETPWWTLPLIVGGGIAANNYYDNGNDDYGDYDDYDDGGGLSSRHVQWCLNRYQSYNPRYNTWVAYSGQVKKCYSPYM